MKKTTLIAILILILIAISVGIYLLFNNQRSKGESEESDTTLQIYQEQGVKIEVLKEGRGEGAGNNDSVSVHYVGWLESGEKFDSSLKRGKPYTFVLGTGSVIRGWDVGVLGMKLGEKRKLTIPPELAYGESGAGMIPPNATLVFEVEMVGINR